MEPVLSNSASADQPTPSSAEPSQPDNTIAAQGAAAASSVELGIAGLAPDAFNLLTGGMYALKARTSSARFPLFASLMTNALAQQRRCFLITASKPQDILERLDPLLEKPTAALIEAGSLHVFGTQADIPKRIFRFGADRFA
jgi:hypothetical protein